MTTSNLIEATVWNGSGNRTVRGATESGLWALATTTTTTTSTTSTPTGNSTTTVALAE